MKRCFGIYWNLNHPKTQCYDKRCPYMPFPALCKRLWFNIKGIQNKDAYWALQSITNDFELFVWTPFIMLETAFYVLWLWKWQCVPPVPYTHYACLPIEWCYDTAPITSICQSFSSESIDFIFSWPLVAMSDTMTDFSQDYSPISVCKDFSAMEIKNVLECLLVTF